MTVRNEHIYPMWVKGVWRRGILNEMADIMSTKAVGRKSVGSSGCDQ